MTDSERECSGPWPASGDPVVYPRADMNGPGTWSPISTADQVRLRLRLEMDGVLSELRRAEGHVRASADRAGVDPHTLVDSRGYSVLAPLLIARAQALAALMGLG